MELQKHRHWIQGKRNNTDWISEVLHNGIDDRLKWRLRPEQRFSCSWIDGKRPEASSKTDWLIDSHFFVVLRTFFHDWIQKKIVVKSSSSHNFELSSLLLKSKSFMSDLSANRLLKRKMENEEHILIYVYRMFGCLVAS